MSFQKKILDFFWKLISQIFHEKFKIIVFTQSNVNLAFIWIMYYTSYNQYLLEYTVFKKSFGSFFNGSSQNFIVESDDRNRAKIKWNNLHSHLSFHPFFRWYLQGFFSPASIFLLGVISRFQGIRYANLLCKKIALCLPLFRCFIAKHLIL